MSYNGWTNYATWNVPLWVDNDYGLYQIRREWLQGADESVTADQVQDFVNIYINGTTPDLIDNDWEGGRIQDVNWGEIAENWEVERLELQDYS